MAEKIPVKVASADFRTNPREAAVWDAYGALHALAVDGIGRDMACSILLSRAAREVRREAGIERAKEVFAEMARTMEEAAKNDL
jgi:hypothetical protein